MRKILAAWLSLALVFSGAVFMPNAADSALAADKKYYTEEFQDISAYANAETKIAPKPLDEGHKDWIFAGWFTDSGCGEPYTKTEGSAYAKFVPAGVLSVKCQIEGGTSSGAPSKKLRVVSAVDSLDYKEVGFKLVINESDRYYKSTKVYTKIVAKEGGVAFQYEPLDFHENAEYFLTGTLVNIPSDAVSTPIQITPWWTTLDGTTVYGVGRYCRIMDFYDGIFNIPIRLYSEEEVAAGYLEVAYDADTFEYQGIEEGDVFGEMQAAGIAEYEEGVVRCVGRSMSISSNAGNEKADGMYVNLRLKLKEGKTVPVGDMVFRVSGRDFCNNQEEVKDVYVPDGVYRTLPTK